MSNIVSFIRKNGHLSFSELPLQQADFLVLSYLSYANFEGTEKSKKIINNWHSERFLDFSDDFTLSIINKNFLLPKQFLTIYKVILSSKRYKDLKLSYMIDKKDEEIETQFFAISFIINNNLIIAFRGTDRDFVGRKEDFNMAVLDKIPSENYAYEYVLNAMKKHSNKKTYIIGHSKGGLLAFSAFFNLTKQFKKRVEKVYNLDGPGFKNDKHNYELYKEKLVKIIPSECVIGILYDYSKNYQIVKTKKYNIFAHNIAAWELNSKNEFRETLNVKKLNFYSEVLQYTFKSVINDIKDADKKIIIDFIFDIIYVNKSNDILEVARLVRLIQPKYLKILNDLSVENRNIIYKALVLFIKEYFYIATHFKEYKKTHPLKGELNEIHFNA